MVESSAPLDYCTGSSKPMDPGPSRGNGHVEAGTSVQDLGESLFPYSAPSVWERGGQQGGHDSSLLHRKLNIKAGREKEPR